MTSSLDVVLLERSKLERHSFAANEPFSNRVSSLTPKSMRLLSSKQAYEHGPDIETGAKLFLNEERVQPWSYMKVCLGLVTDKRYGMV
jgi:hypothetical protein